MNIHDIYSINMCDVHSSKHTENLLIRNGDAKKGASKYKFTMHMKSNCFRLKKGC